MKLISRYLSRATSVLLVAMWFLGATKDVVLSHHDPMDVGYAWFTAYLFMSFMSLTSAGVLWHVSNLKD